jgi:hypothetical protein
MVDTARNKPDGCLDARHGTLQATASGLGYSYCAKCWNRSRVVLQVGMSWSIGRGARVSDGRTTNDSAACELNAMNAGPSPHLHAYPTVNRPSAI